MRNNSSFGEAPLIDRLFDSEFFDDKSILITGGTGSLDNELVSLALRGIKGAIAYF
jgi:FlaA1/EpsC-like NDP-sugar epimerase